MAIHVTQLCEHATVVKVFLSFVDFYISYFIA